MLYRVNPNPQNQGLAMCSAASTLHQQGQSAQARHMYIAAADIIAAALGPGNLRLADVHVELATVCDSA